MKSSRIKTLRLLLLAISTISIIAFLINQIDSDLRTFPFEAEVWGTVADWIMIFVTFITAVLLYHNLQSQIRVTSLQQQIAEIEQDKHRMSTMPKIQATKMRSTQGDLNPDNRQFYSSVSMNIIEMTNNGISNISFNTPTVGWAARRDPYPPNPNANLLPDEGFTLFCEGEGHLSNGKKHSSCFIEMFFSDRLGNQYLHRILYSHYDGEDTIKQLPNQLLVAATV